MAFLGDFLSSDKTSSTTNSSTTAPNLPDWLQTALNNNVQTGLGQLQTLAGTTADQRITGFTPDQLAAQQRVEQGTGQYDDIINSALGTLQTAQAGVNPDDINKFMNPYTQNVIDQTKTQAVKDADVQRQQLNSQASMQGAFGGGRNAIEQSNLTDSLGRNLTNIQYQGLQDAYNSALGAAQTSNSQSIAAGQATGAVAGQGQQIYNNDTQALNNSGTAQQALQQAQTDFTYTNPYNTTLQGQQLIQGASPLYGTTTNGTTTNTTPTAGWGSQLLGAATAVAGLGTGGGSTIAGSLLGSWLGGGASGGTTGGSGSAWDSLYKDGGAVHMADGGEPLTSLLGSIGASSTDADSPTLVNRNLSPLEKMVMDVPGNYTPGTSVPVDMSSYAQTPSQQLAGESGVPDLSDNSQDQNIQSAMDAQIDANQNNGILPPPTDDSSSGGNGGSSDMAKVPHISLLESMADKPSSAVTGALANMVTPSGAAPAQKTRLQRMLDDTNLPLLKMGLTMMASDKPFGQAIGEGGLSGAAQIDKEREDARKQAIEEAKNQVEQSKAANEAIKNANMANYRQQSLGIESLKAKGYLENAQAQAAYARSKGKGDANIQKASLEAAKKAQSAYDNDKMMGGDENSANLARTQAFNAFMENYRSQTGQQSDTMGTVQEPPANSTSNIIDVDDVLNGTFGK